MAKIDENRTHDLIKKLRDLIAFWMFDADYINLPIDKKKAVIDEVKRKIDYYK